MRQAARSETHATGLEGPMLEVVLLWGEQSVLYAAHLVPPRSFCVGDETDDDGKPVTDFVIGSETLGVARLPITCEGLSGPCVVVPAGARLEVAHEGSVLREPELRMRGALEACAELASASQYALPRGASARVDYRGFRFIVTHGEAVQPAGVGEKPRIDWQQNRFTLASFALHAAVLSLLYFLPPRSSALALDDVQQNSRLVQYRLDQYEIEPEPPTWVPSDARGDGDPGQGERASEDEGKAGDERAPKTHGRLAVPGPKDNPEPKMPRWKAIELAQQAGIIGTLRASAAAWNSPSSPYGAENALGSDPVAALGALFGTGFASNQGNGGVGMLGPGRGGGGHAIGTIGVGPIGTIGGVAGYGRGAGGLRGREAKVPRPINPKIDVRGSLSKEVIRRIVRRHLSEVRYCYEQALQTRPDLQGRVAVRFIIAPSGEVQAAATASSDISDPRTEACIATAVKRWTFPAPDGGGLVVVTYPFVLQQTGD